jgi:hypothetical protein
MRRIQPKAAREVRVAAGGESPSDMRLFCLSNVGRSLIQITHTKARRPKIQNILGTSRFAFLCPDRPEFTRSIVLETAAADVR